MQGREHGIRMANAIEVCRYRGEVVVKGRLCDIEKYAVCSPSEWKRNSLMGNGYSVEYDILCDSLDSAKEKIDQTFNVLAERREVLA